MQKSDQSVFDEYFEEQQKKPFWEKIYFNVRMHLMFWNCSVKHAFDLHPKNLKTRNDVCLHILDDIEFGYDAKMIRGKILSGSYGNTPMSVLEKRNIVRRIKKMFEK
jgi:hypothetical protein